MVPWSCGLRVVGVSEYHWIPRLSTKRSPVGMIGKTLVSQVQEEATAGASFFQWV